MPEFSWYKLIQKRQRGQTCEICCGACQGSIPLCEGCRKQLPWITQSCVSCGEPVPATTSHCSRCVVAALPFSQVIIPLRYSFPLNQWIGTYKYREMPGMAHWLGALLAETIRDRIQQRPDTVIGVPMHPTQQRKRGYNQSTLLARIVARKLELPFSNTLLIKARSTAHQRSLNAATRRQNLQNAFVASEDNNHQNNKHQNNNHLRGKHIALIDDVVTTGATSAEIATCLLEAGAVSVSLWALAKTPMANPLPLGRHAFFL